MKLQIDSFGNCRIINSNNCSIELKCKINNTFSKELLSQQNREKFCESIKHKFIDIAFLYDREIYIAIAGCRNLKIPKRCKTLEDVATWINSKNF